MTIETILERLALLHLPFAHIAFEQSEDAPPPPFIVWLSSETVRGADYRSELAEVSMSIELYTDYVFTAAAEAARAALSGQIESIVLPDVEHKKFEASIPDEDLVQTAYEFTFLQKRKRG